MTVQTSHSIISNEIFHIENARSLLYTIHTRVFVCQVTSAALHGAIMTRLVICDFENVRVN